MKRVYKYELPVDGGVITIYEKVIQWLEIHEQGRVPHIWAIVDDEAPAEFREIVAWGTGWPIFDEAGFDEYLGTCEDGLGYVWHYFTRLTENEDARS